MMRTIQLELELELDDEDKELELCLSGCVTHLCNPWRLFQVELVVCNGHLRT